MLDVYEAHGQCHRLSQGKITDTEDSPWCSNTVPRWANASWGNGIDHAALILACPFGQTMNSIDLFVELGQTFD